eukprot:gene2856-4925_t
MDIIPMLCTHMDADKAAEDETTRGHFTTFTAAPTVNKKFSLPFLQWPLEGSVRVGGLQMHIGSADYDFRPGMFGGLQMHIGSADYDFRPGMYDVPLIHPSVDPTNSLPVLANTLDRGQSDMSLSRMDKTDVSGTSRLGKCLLGKSETRRMNNPRADNLSPDLVSRSMGSVDLNSLPPTHHKRSVSLMPATSSGSKQQEAASQTAKVAEELSEKVAASRGKDVAEGVAEDELSEQGAEGQREDVAEGVAEAEGELSEQGAENRGEDVAEGVAEDELSEKVAECQREEVVAEGVADGELSEKVAESRGGAEAEGVA